MKPDELLDLAQNATQETDAGLARRLAAHRQTIHLYRSGKRPMPDHHIAALAALAGLDAAATLASIRAEQAPPETAKVWAEIARRAALSAAVLALVNASPLGSTPAYATKSLHNLYIMLTRRLARGGPNQCLTPT